MVIFTLIFNDPPPANVGAVNEGTNAPEIIEYVIVPEDIDASSIAIELIGEPDKILNVPPTFFNPNICV